MSENKKKFITISCVLTAILFLFGFSFIASEFPFNQTYSTLILGCVAFLVFGVLYKVISEIWR